MFLTLLTAAALSNANPFVTKIHKGHTKAFGQFQITYPVFKASAAPAYRQINAVIAQKVRDAHCEPNDSRDMDYSQTLTVKTITPDFVSLEDQTDGSCGGAHPWVSRGGVTFDARTGQEINLNVELGEPAAKDQWSDADYAQYEQATQRMRKFVAAHISVEDGRCFNEENGLPTTPPDMEEALASVSFSYSLERGSVVIYGEPPHVMYVCAFEVNAPYAEIKDLLEARSPLHQWLGR